MAAPTLLEAGTGLAMTVASNTVSITAAVGNFIVLHLVEDGFDGSSTDFALGTVTNVANLAGTASSMTLVPGDQYGNTGWAVGTTVVALQWIYVGRATDTAIQVFVTSTGFDLYARLYEFQDVRAGTSLADVIENSTAGSAVNGTGLSTSVLDSGVTTLGADRLALNFVGINDDATGIAAFIGMTGGTWAMPATFESATGTDGTISLMTAAMALAGTIDGGADTITSDSWGVVGFALKGTTPDVVVEPTYTGLRAGTGVRSVG